MRAPVDHIHAPPFPARIRWINAATLRMDQQRGRPVLIEFWDFCRPNSLHTLPYMIAWHQRYADSGLRVIGVHTSGFPPSRDPDAVAGAVTRLQIPYPVVVDVDYEIWNLYGNMGWPSRYLFNQEGVLFAFHHGEGGYEDTEREIQELLGVETPTIAPRRGEDVPGALLTPPTEDVEGEYSGPYEAGEVWAVLEGAGDVTANGRVIAVTYPGAYELVSHPRSTAGVLELTIGDGVRCHAVCFMPGLAP